MSALVKTQSSGCHHLSSRASRTGFRDSELPDDGRRGRVLLDGRNGSCHHDRGGFSPTRLAWTGVCGAFAHIQWRSECSYVTGQGNLYIMFRKRLSRLLLSALGNRNCLHQARHGRSPALNTEHGRVQSLREHAPPHQERVRLDAKEWRTRSFRRERFAEMPIVQAMASAAARLLGSPITSISCK